MSTIVPADPPDRSSHSNGLIGRFLDLHLSLKPPIELYPATDQPHRDGDRNNTIFLPSYRPALRTTVPVKYYVKVGKFFAEDSYLVTFRFTEHENASIHAARSDEAANNVRFEAKKQYAFLVLADHRRQMLWDRDWECAICKQPAVTLHMLVILSDQNLNPRAPSVLCNAAPICSREAVSACREAAGVMLKKKVKVDYSPVIGEEADWYCENCGTGKDIKFCGLCGSVGYCSKECQRAGWAEHRIFCKGYVPNDKNQLAEEGLVKEDTTEEIEEIERADRIQKLERIEDLIRETYPFSVVINITKDEDKGGDATMLLF
ncbi:uncharacterized protein BP5553_09288 [Venustampulla echinocandica]|uniref:MYND-type domain-containing protein n=1 Tax=Venustampulla echinocandica TaxID=2656787 RepID=A0A370TCD2_9HELO|nr:uncharacterized protein BP5553_09288 [Venustampulla echinocandica]RDL31886.1 hypothetical protein BP5553_09288 [Venustampulla echinocandica]